MFYSFIKLKYSLLRFAAIFSLQCGHFFLIVIEAKNCSLPILPLFPLKVLYPISLI